jgi:hypothetical protein
LVLVSVSIPILGLRRLISESSSFFFLSFIFYFPSVDFFSHVLRSTWTLPRSRTICRCRSAKGCQRLIITLQCLVSDSFSFIFVRSCVRSF